MRLNIEKMKVSSNYLILSLKCKSLWMRVTIFRKNLRIWGTKSWTRPLFKLKIDLLVTFEVQEKWSQIQNQLCIEVLHLIHGTLRRLINDQTHLIYQSQKQRHQLVHITDCYFRLLQVLLSKNLCSFPLASQVLRVQSSLNNEHRPDVTLTKIQSRPLNFKNSTNLMNDFKPWLT